MDSYHCIYLQWTDNITFTYNERYHNIYLQLTIAIAYTCMGRLSYNILTMDGYQKHKLTMNGYYSIYLQWTVTITYAYN